MSHMRLAVFALGTTEIALAASVVREAVAVGEELVSPAPQSPAWAVGSILVRDVPIPVIDLSEWLGEEAAADDIAACHIVIVCFEGRRLGFVVDRVRDLLEVDSADLYPVHDARADSVTRWMVSPESGRAIYVLELAAILALKGNIQIESATPGDALEQVAHEARQQYEEWPGQRLVVARAGESRLGFALASVREICPAQDIEPPVIAESSYLGHIMWRGQRLPLLDIGPLLGRDPARRVGEHYLVIQTVVGLIAIAVEQVVGLIDHDPQQKRSEVRLQHNVSAVVGAIDDATFGQILLLDHDRLAAHETAAGLAVASGQSGVDQAVSRVWQRFAFIDFDAGTSYSVPIDTLTAVQRYPDQVTPAARDTPFSGYCVQEGRHVALIDLRHLLGHATRTQTSDQLLIVAHEDHFIGFVVDGVREMHYVEAPADSYIERWRGDRALNTAPVDECKQLITLGEGEDLRFISILRLQLLAQRLLESAGLVGTACETAMHQPI